MLKLFIKRFLLIIIGIILSLILLECGLRLAGWTISSFQQYKNNKALRNKSQYTIMCLGESTTQGQYPVQLQEILDMKYPNKFSVIDCGISGTNLENILELLDNNINKYNPNITVCMMGGTNIINFGKEKHLYSHFESIIFKLKFIKLSIFSYRYIKQKLILKELNKFNKIKKLKEFAESKKTNNMFSENIYVDNNSSFEYAIILKSQGKFREAEKILKEILKDNPNDEKAFNELCILYADFLYEKELGYNMATKALINNFNFGKEWYYKIIFEECNYKNMIDELKYYIYIALNEDLHIFSSDIKYFLYGYIKDYITEEQREKILQIIIKNNDGDYGLMAIELINNKNYKKAQEYFNKAEELRLKFPNMEMYNLYKLIVKKLMDNNIKVICMQYPVRSIKSLQEQLKNESYYNKITFISNEKLFKDALMKHNYDDLFVDQFAGDFGHCTESGNTMIAENVVNTLENILDLREKSN